MSLLKKFSSVVAPEARRAIHQEDQERAGLSASHALHGQPEKERQPGLLSDRPASAGHRVTARKKPGFLRGGKRGWLLLQWDIAGMQAMLVNGLGETAHPLARAHSSQADFSEALAEVLEQLRAGGNKIPRRVAMAARHMRPAVVDLPVNPDKPRPAAQMRELLRNDMEPVLSEFASLWTMGALLQARNYLSPGDRDRVVAEEAMRREDRRTPLRYGETALELALIDRVTLNACIELQSSLQMLDDEVQCAWLGWVAHGERYWLATALISSFYRQWQHAATARGLQLDTVLPLAWLCSSPDVLDVDARMQDIAFELHAEEVLAVRRRDGRIVAARSDARMERPLQSDWLLRLIEDWVDEAQAQIRLVCLNAQDEAAALHVAADIELTTGRSARVIPAARVTEQLWAHLAGETAALPASQSLPRLVLRDLRGKPWKNPDFLRLGVLMGVVLSLLGVQGVQQYRLRSLQSSMSERSHVEKEEQKRSQTVLKVNAEMQGVAKALENARAEMEPLLNSLSRMEAIAGMRQNLPGLITMLAESVEDDVVLEKIGNSRHSQDATSILVEAWSTSYTGAQAFVNRVAARTQSLSYGVVQTEIHEDLGRNNKAGYRVGFWLMTEPEGLEGGYQTGVVASDTTGGQP